MVIICAFGTKMAVRYPCDLFYPITLIIMRNAENHACPNSYKYRALEATCKCKIHYYLELSLLDT